MLIQDAKFPEINKDEDKEIALQEEVKEAEEIEEEKPKNKGGRPRKN